MKSPRRRAAAVVAALLIAACLASLWHLRSRKVAPALAASWTVAPPFVTAGKKPPARDFKRRSGYTITPRAEGEKADPESPPHPLDAEIAKRAERWKPWRTTKTDLRYQDLPLDAVLADLTNRYGLKFLVVEGFDISGKTVTFKVDQLAADQTVDLIFKMADIRTVLAADGTMILMPKDADPAPWDSRDSDELMYLEVVEANRDADTRLQEQDAANDAFWSSVKGRVLGKEVPSATIYDSIDTLQETIQLNIVLSANIRRSLKDLPTIPALPAGKSLAETLDAWASAAGVSWKIEKSLVYFGMAEEIGAAKDVENRRRTERKAKADALAALLARNVRVSGDNLAIRQVATLLGEALGVPVRLDPVTWHRAARITLSDDERPAIDIVRILQASAPVVVTFREGILWFLAPTPPPPDYR